MVHVNQQETKGRGEVKCRSHPSQVANLYLTDPQETDVFRCILCLLKNPEKQEFITTISSILAEEIDTVALNECCDDDDILNYMNSICDSSQNSPYNFNDNLQHEQEDVTDQGSCISEDEIDEILILAQQAKRRQEYYDLCRSENVKKKMKTIIEDINLSREDKERKLQQLNEDLHYKSEATLQEFTSISHSNVKSILFSYSRYFGEYEGGKFNGQDNQRLYNGDEKIGRFNDDQERGQGTFKLNDDCEQKDIQLQGHGQLKWLDGSKYVGEFMNGIENGQGTKTWLDGSMYIGKWKNGYENGKGTKTWSCGKKYIGEWYYGSEVGKGTLTQSSGEKYVGQWKRQWNCGRISLYHGEGTLTLPDGLQYAGEFEDGYLKGQGSLTFPSGDKYVGELKDFKREGQGTLTKHNGEQYIGKWKNDKLNGEVKFTKPNGEKYIGKFKDSNYHGQGVLTSSDGSVQRGLWKGGEFMGKQIQHKKDRQVR